MADLTFALANSLSKDGPVIIAVNPGSLLASKMVKEEKVLESFAMTLALAQIFSPVLHFPMNSRTLLGSILIMIVRILLNLIQMHLMVTNAAS